MLEVKAWREKVTIPTYEIGHPEKAPMFMENRVYQGSSGVVYPYPVIESISDKETPIDYNAIWLENKYIKVMILPELGGRIQMAYDKIKKRHFVYYNHVIKPALVGLAGPWISGGIEFNWPQHHRPSTFMPVDSSIETFEDGSVTVWVSEVERMFHQKGMAGFTLHPNSAYLEIKGRLYNRTDVPQTFLWWANPAVAVNDDYQSVFPQDVNAVFDHGKRDVSTFPIATGTYYKMDYSAGVDISNYKNIKVPTSYMAVNSKYDFVGGYENDSQGGMLHVASHHFSPGKKQWTWGKGDFGKAWDHNLTDEDGPYIELMAGVYTENQPDFSWLMPYEEKVFTQYFMPYRELGIVKNASHNLIMNIEEITLGRVRLRIQATNDIDLRILVKDDEDNIHYNERLSLSPEKLFDQELAVDGTEFSSLSVYLFIVKENGEKLDLYWHSESDSIRPIPDAAVAAQRPQEIKSCEQLYLTGLHLEQYRHATFNPMDYYEEALRRDPLDYRCNNAMGLLFLRKCRFELAEKYLRTAVKVITKFNPNPYDGEPIYNLALALKYQGQLHEAYELFWKSTWNKAWADAGYFEAAKISIAQGRLDDALDELNRCLNNHYHNHKARAMKASVLRLLNRQEEALKLCDESLIFDKFNDCCLYERYLITKKESDLNELKQLLRGSSSNYIELALEYIDSGQKENAINILKMSIADGVSTPMTYYYIGWVGNSTEAFDYAESMNGDYCFPNRPQDVLALEAAMTYNPNSSHASYYLGCLYFDKRQYDLAGKYWNLSAKNNGTSPLVWRNLALLSFNKLNEKDTALSYMQKSFELNKKDARILMELDQLYARMQWPPEDRLNYLKQFPDLIAKRDDLLLSQITLLNQTGKYEEALSLIDKHIFHPWEGGEGKVPAQYQYGRMKLSIELMQKGEFKSAIKLLEDCLIYPLNLGEGKLEGAKENDIHYLLGCAYEGTGDIEKAELWWNKAAEGNLEPVVALYYNDAKPDKIYYQGLALAKLGRQDEANKCFFKLISYGKKHFYDKSKKDYFAVSLPDMQIWIDNLDSRLRMHCIYMLGLGYLGTGDLKRSETYIQALKALDINFMTTAF